MRAIPSRLATGFCCTPAEAVGHAVDSLATSQHAHALALTVLHYHSGWLACMQLLVQDAYEAILHCNCRESAGRELISLTAKKAFHGWLVVSTPTLSPSQSSTITAACSPACNCLFRMPMRQFYTAIAASQQAES